MLKKITMTRLSGGMYTVHCRVLQKRRFHTDLYMYVHVFHFVINLRHLIEHQLLSGVGGGGRGANA